jgi:hypothetical protein
MRARVAGLPDGREPRVLRQLICELDPRQTLGIPVVERWRNGFRVIEAANGNVNQSGNVVRGEADLRTAASTETPPPTGRRFVSRERALDNCNLGLLKHCPSDHRSSVCAAAHRAMTNRRHERITDDSISNRAALAATFLYWTRHKSSAPGLECFSRGGKAECLVVRFGCLKRA